jgi:hypothetical protein
MKKKIHIYRSYKGKKKAILVDKVDKILSGYMFRIEYNNPCKNVGFWVLGVITAVNRSI